MLDRVAVHQTRLRTPGLGLDAKGVALGAKGLVLLPSIDRLVAFLALYTRQGSLADILRSLTVEIVRSKLGAREVTLLFAAESSDRLDRVAEIARLAGGYSFTGTNRHFVQYRDAAAPFGYDVPQILPSDAALSLYHNAFSQTYEVERLVDVRALLLRLEPHLDPTAGRDPGPRWLLAESGLGPALIRYFSRSSVEAEVGLCEWPPESSFDDAPVLRYLFRAPAIPGRMVPLLTSTPGLGYFVPVAPGAAVEVGFRHPINLRACPVFGEAGLVLFRGGGREALGDREAAGDGGRLGVRPGGDRPRARGGADDAGGRRAAPRVGRAVAPPRPELRAVAVGHGLVIRPEEMPLLRHVAYALGPETLRRARIAFTAAGAFLRHPTGIEGIPVGEFFREVHPGLYIPAGYDAVPAVAPGVLFRALGAPAGQALFIGRDGRAIGVPDDGFVPLETALLEAQEWSAVAVSSAGLTAALATELPEVVLGSVGIRPLRDLAPSEAMAEPQALPGAGRTPE